MTQKSEKVYKNKWVIKVERLPAVFKNIVTPSFVPFLENDTAFCFKAWYQELDPINHDLFKLKLVKLSSAPVSPTLEATISVHVYYSDGYLFESFPKQLLTGEIVTFKDVLKRNANGFQSTTHYNKMTSNTLLIQCHITYNYQDETLEMKSSNKTNSSSKYGGFVSNLKSIYEPSVLSDFVFNVGDKSFPAHKIILAAHSPVFKNMMTHEFLESETNSVTITDATPEVFELFLRSLYGGELENKSWDSLKELYYLVDKYDVGFLKVQCAEAVISLLSVDLLCEMLKLAYNISDSDLKTAAINFAVSHIKEIVLREDWKDLVKTLPNIGYEVTVNFIPK